MPSLPSEYLKESVVQLGLPELYPELHIEAALADHIMRRFIPASPSATMAAIIYLRAPKAIRRQYTHLDLAGAFDLTESTVRNAVHKIRPLLAKQIVRPDRLPASKNKQPR